MRAQRLLGQGTDVIGCEAFGLDRFTHAGDRVSIAEQAVREAEVAAAIPTGTEQWLPGALKFVLLSAYEEAASAYVERHSAEDASTAEVFKVKIGRLQLAQVPQADISARSSTGLLAAVLQNDLERVTQLLAQGVNVDTADADRTSGLRLAVVTGRLEMVKLLLLKGASPDIADEEGVTGLMDACSMGRPDIAVLLIEAGANMMAAAYDGSTCLLNAIGQTAVGVQANRKREFIRELIARHADVNTADWASRTPLHEVAIVDGQLISMLLSGGARIDAQNRDGETALMAAVSRVNVDAVRVLLENGAATELVDKLGRSALSRAVKNGFPEGEQMTRLLLQAGANPNLRNPRFGSTPLMEAEDFSYKGAWGVSSRTIVGLLLKHGAEVNFQANDGTSALLVAANHAGPDDASFLNQLIDAGGEVNVRGPDGQTPLMTAAERGFVNRVRVLLASGARADAKDDQSRTAIDYARQPRGDCDDGPHCLDWSSGWDPPSNCAATRRVLKEAINASRRARQ